MDTKTDSFKLTQPVERRPSIYPIDIMITNRIEALSTNSLTQEITSRFEALSTNSLTQEREESTTSTVHQHRWETIIGLSFHKVAPHTGNYCAGTIYF